MLAANIQEKYMHSEMFNDSIMVVFIYMAFYFMQNNWPRLASAAIGISLTIKAGGILLFPPLLGWVQYQHGTFKLLDSIFILLIIQIIAASPFVYTPAAEFMGFKLGAQTELQHYLIDSKILGGDVNQKKLHGADYSNSMYWQFFTRETYYHDFFCRTLQLLILL